MAHEQNGFLGKNIGFLKRNRFIGNLVRNVLNCINYLHRENKRGKLAFTDFEKAFARINGSRQVFRTV